MKIRDQWEKNILKEKTQAIQPALFFCPSPKWPFAVGKNIRTKS